MRLRCYLWKALNSYHAYVWTAAEPVLLGVVWGGAEPQTFARAQVRRFCFHSWRYSGIYCSEQVADMPCATRVYVRQIYASAVVPAVQSGLDSGEKQTARVEGVGTAFSTGSRGRLESLAA